MQKLFENWRKYINEYGAAGMGGNIATIAGAGRAPMAYDNLPKTKNFELGDDVDASVKAVLFMNDGTIVLLKNEKGWDLPGGHMREGETKVQALKREVFEETGIQINNINNLHHKSGNKNFFSGQCMSDDIILSGEHSNHIFLDPQDLYSHDIADEFIAAISIALEKR